MTTLPSGLLINAVDPFEIVAAKTNVRRMQTAAGALEEEDFPPFFLWLSDPVELSEPDLEPLLLLLRGLSFFFFFFFLSFVFFCRHRLLRMLKGTILSTMTIACLPEFASLFSGTWSKGS